MQDEKYEQYLTGEEDSPGVTLGDKGKIKIFLFLFGDVKKNRQEIINLIGNIYHELRHAWQAKHNLYQDEEEIVLVKKEFQKYLQLPSEKDAYKFEISQLEKHIVKILEIFGQPITNQNFTLNVKPEIKEAIFL